MDKSFKDMIPLLLFTIGAGLASALMIGLVISRLTGKEIVSMEKYFLWGFITITVGILISLFHLGKKRIFYHSILGMTHSWLSVEVIAASLLGGVYFVGYGSLKFDIIRIDPTVILMIGGILSLVLSLTIGLVYDLESRGSWEGWPNTLSALSTPLLLGILLATVWNKDISSGLFFYLIWGVDSVLASARFLRFLKISKERGGFVFGHLQAIPKVAIIIRLLLSLFILREFLYDTSGKGGLGLIIMGIILIILDRVILYTSVTEQSAGYEMTRLKNERMKEALR